MSPSPFQQTVSRRCLEGCGVEQTLTAVATKRSSRRLRMSDHDGQRLGPREMIQAHTYPVLAAVSSLSLIAIAVQLVPIAQQASTFNACVRDTYANPEVKPHGQALATVICNGFIPKPARGHNHRARD